MSAVFALLGVAFAAEAAGLFGHELNSALAALLLILSAALAPRPAAELAAANRTLLFAGAALAAVGLALTPGAWDIRYFGAALWFFGLDTIWRARGARSSLFLPLGIGCAIAGLFEWCAGASLLSWYAVQAVSRWVSESAGSLCGHPISLGPTFNGVGMLVLGTGIAVGGLAVAPAARRAVARFIAVLAAIALIYLGYLCIFSIGTILGPIYPLFVPLILPAVLSLPIAWYLAGAAAPEAPPDAMIRIGWRPYAVMAASGLLAAWALTNVPAPTRQLERRVALYEKGFLNWLVPTHQNYGRYSSGMFGNLPILIRCMGWDAKLVPEINEQTLAGKDILVLINQEEALPDASIREIERFVRGGGSLLVMGDHTFWKDEKQPVPDEPIELVLNDPIESSDIRVRFDSADFFIGGWLHSYRYGPHMIAAGLGDRTNEAGSVVGASVEIAYPAAPLLIGRYGYSDPGVPKATERGYLGNLDYDPGEMLGDIVLAAVQDVGRGRVLVFGDTSSFTNAIQNRTWPFVQRVFSWLGNPGRAAIPWWRDALGILLAAAAAVTLLCAAGSSSLALAVTGLVFILGVSISHEVVKRVGAPPPLRAYAVVERDQAPPKPFEGKVAFVDLSHVGRFSLEGWDDDAIDGLQLHLMREGYFALSADRFDEDQIAASDLFVTIAPTCPYTPAEVRILRRFMENGGTILLAVGWEDLDPAKPLLDSVGLAVAGRPLGRLPGGGGAVPENPMFYEAWPVVGGETIFEVSGDPIVARQKVGKGQIVVIGDSSFLLNKNLEVIDGAILQNVRFLSWLLRRVMNG